MSELAFEPDDPLLARVRALAIDLPGAQEKLVVGHPAFYTRKVFCYYGMSHKVDGHWERRPRTVSFLLPEDERRAMLEDPRVHVPGYIGPYGWLSMFLNDETDWAEVAELIQLSYRETAGKRLAAQLDRREEDHPGPSLPA
ncbi:MmcQ/YjbR family DNA-binding protein [Tessaracoccus flavescens]|uniref:Phosphoribosylglycinamide formyltransferase n=1 Tax=Tessaracoccus flavescens TaxID=399497 RepID=A0A1Q2D2G1_9ACTN|nr:MmcQ/YjbR family DNA-binding protein [Tessaracoccus flavescens]AQP52505.1 hypothetical protein BW733_06735 [Tessaracoccus flavescens]